MRSGNWDLNRAPRPCLPRLACLLFAVAGVAVSLIEHAAKANREWLSLD
jgi:hypothetical protein